jgi:hypothetical protein
MLYQLSYFRIYLPLWRLVMYKERLFFVPECEIRELLRIEKKTLLVFWRVQGAFRNFNFRFAFVAHAVKAVAATQYECGEGKQLYVEEEAG